MRTTEVMKTAASGAGEAPIKVSFEFFPPADAEMEATLWKSIERRTRASWRLFPISNTPKAASTGRRESVSGTPQ